MRNVLQDARHGLDSVEELCADCETEAFELVVSQSAQKHCRFFVLERT